MEGVNWIGPLMFPMENFRKYDRLKWIGDSGWGVDGRTIASLRLTTPIDLTRNYCSNHTRDSCLLFIYRLRCIFDAARPNNRQANIRYNGDRIFPHIMLSTVRNSLLVSLFPKSFSLSRLLSTQRLFEAVIARIFCTKDWRENLFSPPFPCILTNSREFRFEQGNKPVQSESRIVRGTPPRWHNYSCTMVYSNG